MLRLYRDLKRIVAVTENLLYLAGRSLQRRAMRNGVLVTLAMSSGIFKLNYLSAQSLSREQVTALVIVAFASYPAGSVLVRIAAFLNREHIDAAAGGYLQLTSHYKQSRTRLHLDYLWHEVFRHDPLQRTPPWRDDGAEARGSTHTPPTEDQFGLFHIVPIADVDEQRAHDRFVAIGAAALGSPQPMGLQSARTGFHLGPLEDWYEKGLFAYEDFPARAFSRDPLVRRARRLVEPGHRRRIRRLFAPETAPSFWYAFTVRKFSTLLGKALTRLNAEAERLGFPDYFDAQHFIWPSVELDHEVATRFETVDADLERRLRESRKTLIREVFSDDGPTARRHVMRMFSRDYAWIFLLRLRFDGAWAAGRLEARPGLELEIVDSVFSLCPVGCRRASPLIHDARGALDLLDQVLGDRRGEIDAALYQVMQVAAHVDYRGFRNHFLETGDPVALAALIDTPPPGMIRDLGLLREVLHRVRIYHALIKLQILDYMSIVIEIGEFPRKLR